MIKLLIGGSPCTYWSIAQKGNRETEAEGIGWELFKNYLIAKEKFQPDYFLYENNKSAAQPIKDQISQALGVDLMHINSALVSAQNRFRFYAFNWEAPMPEDRDIHLKDILETSDQHRGGVEPQAVNYQVFGRKKNAEGIYERTWEARTDGKANTLTTVGSRRMVAEPIGAAYRNRREQDGKLYPRFETNGTPKANAVTTVRKDSMVAIPETDSELHDPSIYEVKDGKIEVKGKWYPVKLQDGLWRIREYTPIECERLQTLPDNYTAAVSKTQRYKGLGNGWTAEVIIHLLSYALKDVPRDEQIVVLSMYDGIGTGYYCLKQLGFTNITYYAYEIDKAAKQVALSNHPDIIELGDAFDVLRDDWALPEITPKPAKKSPARVSVRRISRATHELKILPGYFAAVISGAKTFEVRKDDRPYKPGDVLALREYDGAVYTGRTCNADVLYVLRGEYCRDGYCIMSIKPRVGGAAP